MTAFAIYQVWHAVHLLRTVKSPEPRILIFIKEFCLALLLFYGAYAMSPLSP